MLAIKAENISKQYRLGEVGTGTLSHDLNRFWHKVRGKEDPYLRIGEANDRTTKGESDYVWSLRDINFEIEQGDAVGIIGRNGAGKSTLLKILSKVTKPTTGSIKVNGRIASLLEVGTGFHPEMTGRENIYLNGAILGMRKHEITRKLDEIIDFSGVERYIDTPVKRYSSGMYVRLAFAVAAHLESEVLIVDEVLAVGDAEFQKKCLGKMSDVSKGEGRTVLFVSHNMAAVKGLCNNGILLENGRVAQSGNISRIIEKYIEDKEVKNKFKKNEGFVRELFVKIIDNIIVITCKFVSSYYLQYPSVVYSITDIYRNKIFGVNPYNNSLTRPPKNPMLAGEIICTINDVRLFKGNYFITAWFGEENSELESFTEVISFEVQNPTGFNYSVNYKDSLGPVVCMPNYEFVKHI